MKPTTTPVDHRYNQNGALISRSPPVGAKVQAGRVNAQVLPQWQSLRASAGYPYKLAATSYAATSFPATAYPRIALTRQQHQSLNQLMQSQIQFYKKRGGGFITELPSSRKVSREVMLYALMACLNESGIEIDEVMLTGSAKEWVLKAAAPSTNRPSEYDHAFDSDCDFFIKLASDPTGFNRVDGAMVRTQMNRALMSLLAIDDDTASHLYGYKLLQYQEDQYPMMLFQLGIHDTDIVISYDDPGYITLAHADYLSLKPYIISNDIAYSEHCFQYDMDSVLQLKQGSVIEFGVTIDGRTQGGWDKCRGVAKLLSHGFTFKDRETARQFYQQIFAHIDDGHAWDLFKKLDNLDVNVLLSLLMDFVSHHSYMSDYRHDASSLRGAHSQFINIVLGGMHHLQGALSFPLVNIAGYLRSCDDLAETITTVTDLKVILALNTMLESNCFSVRQCWQHEDNVLLFNMEDRLYFSLPIGSLGSDARDQVHHQLLASQLLEHLQAEVLSSAEHYFQIAQHIGLDSVVELTRSHLSSMPHPPLLAEKTTTSTDSVRALLKQESRASEDANIGSKSLSAPHVTQSSEERNSLPVKSAKKKKRARKRKDKPPQQEGGGTSAVHTAPSIKTVNTQPPLPSPDVEPIGDSKVSRPQLRWAGGSLELVTEGEDLNLEEGLPEDDIPIQYKGLSATLKFATDSADEAYMQQFTSIDSEVDKDGALVGKGAVTFTLSQERQLVVLFSLFEKSGLKLNLTEAEFSNGDVTYLGSVRFLENKRGHYTDLRLCGVGRLYHHGYDITISGLFDMSGMVKIDGAEKIINYQPAEDLDTSEVYNLRMDWVSFIKNPLISAFTGEFLNDQKSARYRGKFDLIRVESQTASEMQYILIPSDGEMRSFDNRWDIMNISRDYLMDDHQGFKLCSKRQFDNGELSVNYRFDSQSSENRASLECHLEVNLGEEGVLRCIEHKSISNHFSLGAIFSQFDSVSFGRHGHFYFDYPEPKRGKKVSRTVKPIWQLQPTLSDDLLIKFNLNQSASGESIKSHRSITLNSGHLCANNIGSRKRDHFIINQFDYFLRERRLEALMIELFTVDGRVLTMGADGLFNEVAGERRYINRSALRFNELNDSTKEFLPHLLVDNIYKKESAIEVPLLSILESCSLNCVKSNVSYHWSSGAGDQPAYLRIIPNHPGDSIAPPFEYAMAFDDLLRLPSLQQKRFALFQQTDQSVRTPFAQVEFKSDWVQNGWTMKLSTDLSMEDRSLTYKLEIGVQSTHPTRFVMMLKGEDLLVMQRVNGHIEPFLRKMDAGLSEALSGDIHRAFKAMQCSAVMMNDLWRTLPLLESLFHSTAKEWLLPLNSTLLPCPSMKE